MNMRKRFARVVAVVASVWMPLVALPFLVPCLYAEKMLLAKYPLLVIYSFGLDWGAMVYYFIAFIALAALVCDLFHKCWWRVVARIALFVTGWAIMFVIGFHVDGYMRQLRPPIEVHVADADVARISGKAFFGDGFYAILRKISRRTGIESVVLSSTRT